MKFQKKIENLIIVTLRGLFSFATYVTTLTSIISCYFKIFILCLISIPVSAQFQRQKLEYGAHSNMNINIFDANFANLPNIPNCCLKFENGDGLGYSIGFQFSKPYSNFAAINFRLTISEFGGTFNSEEPVGISYNGKLVPVTINHLIESHIYTAGLEAGNVFILFGRLNIFLGQSIFFQINQ